MTDPQSEAGPAVEQSLDPTYVFDHTFDPMLSVLVGVANDSDGFEMGITLNMNGTVVTGLLIGRTAWMDAFAAEYRDAVQEEGPTIADSLRDGFRLEDAAEAASLPGHIHLREAQMFAGDTRIPSNEKILWRGRLAAVSGWSMGWIGAGNDADEG